MPKLAHIVNMLLVCALGTTGAFAASFPTNAYDGSGDVYELIIQVPIETNSMLSAVYDYDAAVAHDPSAVGDFGLTDPLFYNNGYRFEQFQLTPGVDKIYADSLGSVALDPKLFDLIHSSQYGWLVIDWKRDGFVDINGDGLEDFDENPSNYGGNFQGVYVDYFMLPLGNGEYIFLCLALLYATFLFYRNYQKKKELVA